MNRKDRAVPSGKIIKIAGSVLVWFAVLAVLIVISFEPEAQEEKPVFGSLENRFVSDIQMEWDGRTLYYRENEITNYLFIGVDQDDVTATNGHQHGGQADFLVILSIDRVRKTVTPVMLDRDTMVEMQTYGVFGHPSGTRVMQLCLAQAYSGVNIPGCINTVKTVEKLLHGVRIDHYVVLDMAAIPIVNDAIGGVEVTLEDDFTSFDPAMVRGATLRLMGEQAEFFVRGRMTVADGTNASRMERQQQYITAFLQQFRQTIGKEPALLSDLLLKLADHMSTDASEERLISDANSYSAYTWQPLVALQGTHSIDEYGFAEFWADETYLTEMVAGIWFE
ncbi:MAG: LCP family protein [Aristaeellaceae bacterium]